MTRKNYHDEENPETMHMMGDDDCSDCDCDCDCESDCQSDCDCDCDCEGECGDECSDEGGEEEGGEDSSDDAEEGELDEEVFGSREDYENIDDEWFDDDTGDWTGDDYEEFSEQLFGDNEYYGDTAEQRYSDEGYTKAPEDEDYHRQFSSVSPGGYNNFHFFRRGGSIIPMGFLTLGALLLLRKKFPGMNTGLLNVILPGELFNKGRVAPRPLPPELRNVDPSDTVDLRQYCSPVGNQEQTGRCKAFALTHGLELLRSTVAQVKLRLSANYVMMQNQKVDGTFSDHSAAYRADDGTQMGPQHGEQLSKTGVCAEKLWKNDSPLPLAAQKDMDADALKNRIAVKTLPIALDDVKKVLSKGYPVQFAMATGADFQNIGRDGVYHIAEAPEGMHGGHAMLIVGYLSNFFIVKNSWGEDWGDGGYCYIPKKVLQDAGWEFNALIPEAGASAGAKKK